LRRCLRQLAAIYFVSLPLNGVLQLGGKAHRVDEASVLVLYGAAVRTRCRFSHWLAGHGLLKRRSNIVLRIRDVALVGGGMIVNGAVIDQRPIGGR
jgi:hypothetical protein